MLTRPKPSNIQKQVSDKLSYLILRGRWYDMIVINAHGTTEDEDDPIKDSFSEELEETLDQFPSYHMKILFGEFNARAE